MKSWVVGGVRGSALFLAASACARCAFADVLVVSATDGPYTTIQAAVTAAHDGDTLLVKPGSYSAFTVDA